MQKYKFERPTKNYTRLLIPYTIHDSKLTSKITLELEIQLKRIKLNLIFGASYTRIQLNLTTSNL